MEVLVLALFILEDEKDDLAFCSRECLNSYRVWLSAPDKESVERPKTTIRVSFGCMWCFNPLDREGKMVWIPQQNQ